MVKEYFRNLFIFLLSCFCNQAAFAQSRSSSESDSLMDIVLLKEGEVFIIFLIVFILLVITTISLFLYLRTLQKKNSELKKLFAENEQQRKTLDGIFQSAPIGIVITNIDGLILSYNDEFLKLFSLKEPIESRKIQDVVRYPSFAKCPEKIQDSNEDYPRCKTEFLLALPDGTVRHFEYICSLRKDDFSSSSVLTHIFSDITSKKQFELNLKKSEEKYRTYVELSSDPIWCFEGKEPVPIDLPVEEQIELFFNYGYLSDCNLAFAKFYGFESVEEAIGSPLSRIISPANKSKIDMLLHFISNNYTVDNFITYVEDDKGNTFYLQNSMFGIVEDGKLVRVWGTFKDITELLKLQKQYQETSIKYQQLIENVNSIILHIDLTGKILFINTFGLKFFGYEPEELIGKSVIGTIFPAIESETGRNLEELIYDILHNPSKYEYNENENIKKDGTQVWIFWKNTPILDASGKCVEVLSVGIDITERRRAEQELKEAWEIIYKITDVLPDPVCFKDGEGRWVYANKAMLELLDLVGKEVIGKTDYELAETNEFFHDVFERMVETDRSAWRTKTHLRFEEKIKSRDGLEKVLDVIKVPIFNESGNPSGIAMIARDVTLQKEVEKTIKQSEQIHREIVNGLPLPAFVVSRGKIVFVNREAAKLFPKIKEEKIDDLSIFKAYFKEEDFQKFEEVITSSKVITEKQEDTRKVNDLASINVETLDGEKVFSVSFVPILYGTTPSLLVLPVDITKYVLYSSYLEKVQKELIFQKYQLERINKELHEKNSELAKLNATKDRFFSIIAHDLKNPVYGVKNLSDEFLRSFDELTEEEKREFIMAINASSTKLADLLENLLLWSRTQVGSINFNPVEINVKYLVENVLSFFQETAKQKNIVMLSRVDEHSTAYADVNCVSTILRNLISNAIKFTNEGGIVRVFSKEIEEDGKPFVQVSVQDNGVGIPYEAQEKLLELDYYYTTPGTKSERGTGLGLNIVKELVRMNGGRLWFESTPRVGTTFHFTLPAEKLENEPQ
jgi:PAS domain S-box-containing protein